MAHKFIKETKRSGFMPAIQFSYFSLLFFLSLVTISTNKLFYKIAKNPNALLFQSKDQHKNDGECVWQGKKDQRTKVSVEANI